MLSEFSGGGGDILIKILEWVGTGGNEGGGTLQTMVDLERSCLATVTPPARP